MADFSALIAQIEAYVKQNGNNEITGNGLQSILVGMVNALGTVAITALQGDLADEVTARTNADGAINAKIPAEASSSNKLADKAFVTGLTTALQNAVSAINANIENGYVYAGIATPSGTPVSGKVFYLARQAGTYTNFGGLTLTEGVNVLKYNGTAWSQEQLISIADIYKNPLMGYYECDTAGGTAAKTVAATGYVLPTTGGSLKIKMANRNTVANVTLNINSTGAKPLFYNGVRAGVGNTWDTNEVIEVYYDGTNYQAYNVAGSNGDGVFDISAYNLTDGQPTPYVDLAAALGTNGEHVPQSLRKGGMSVKFIQGSVPSSDNNYVQYRLMAQSFTTDVADWLDVDTDVQDICLKAFGTIDIPLVVGIIQESGAFSPENEYRTSAEYIKYVPGARYQFNAQTIRFALYDESYAFLGVSTVLSGNFSYFRVVFATNDVPSGGITLKFYGNMQTDINNLKESVYIPTDFIWEQGALNYGEESDTPLRIRTKGSPICVVGNISIAQGYSFQILYYDSTDTYTDNSGWQKSFYIEEIANIRIMIKKDDNSNITPNVAENISLNLSSSLPFNNKKNLENIRSIIYNQCTFVWEQGAINAGLDADTPIRIRTKYNPQYVIGNISIASDYLFQVTYYNKNGVYISNTDWIKELDIENGSFIRIMIRKNDNSNITPDVASNISLNLSVIVPYINRINIEKITNTVYNPYTFVWEQGGLPYGQEVNATTRIRTNGKPVKVKEASIAVSDQSYSFGVEYYDKYGAYIGESGWVKKYDIYSTSFIRLMVKKDDNSDITPTVGSYITIDALIEKFDIDTNIVNPLWQQGTLNYGVEQNTGIRIRTDFIYVSSGTSIKCNAGYSFCVSCFDLDKKYIGELGWTSSECIVNRDGFIRIVARKGNNEDISVSDSSNILTYLIQPNYAQDLITNTDSTNNIIDEIATLQAKNSVVLSSLTELMTADSAYDIDANGDVYMVYFANPHDINESLMSTYIYLKVIRFNVCNPSDVEVLGTFYANSNILGFTQGNRPPYDPNLHIYGNYVYVYTTLYNDSEEQYYWAILPYNKTTNEFEQHIKCQIKLSGNYVDFNKDNIMDLYDAEGQQCSSELELPLITAKFAYYNGEYYIACGFSSQEQGNHGGMIIKSTDGVNWELVSITPFGSTTKGSYEMSLDILDGILYCAIRGYGGAGIFISSYNLSTGIWSEIKSLPNAGISKPWVECFGEKVYVFYNLNTNFSVNGLERATLRVANVNTDLSVTKVLDFRTDEGCSYPYLKNFNHTLYLSFQSDKRHISTGASRSNMCITSISDLLR